MNPTTRKMFKSRDARNTLRGMGGILASSPELSQTVQQFQDGGNVTAGFGSNPEYTYGTFLAENRLNDTPQAREMFAKYKVYMDTREAPSNPKLFSPAGFDRAPMGLGDAPAPTTSGVEFDPTRQFAGPDMPSSPMRLSGVDAGSAPSVGTASFPQPSEMGPEFNQFGPEGLAARTAAAEVLNNQRMGVLAARDAEADRMMAINNPIGASSSPAEELYPNYLSPEEMADAVAIGENMQRMDETVSELGERLIAPKVGPRAQNFPGAEGRAIMRGDLTAAEMMPPPPPDDSTSAGPDDGTRGDTPTLNAAPVATDAGVDAPVLSDEVIKKVNDPKVLEEAAALTPRPDDTEDDLRSKYDARAKLFREILGEDEAGARNKGMDLAMIGLLIMSGQSPNALTNIAEGGVGGLQAMSARDEAARERQRLVRTTALESVLDEEAAGTAAAATAAEKALDRQNRLDAAKIANSAERDTKTGQVTYRTMLESAFDVATNPLTMPQEVRDGEISAIDWAKGIAKAGLAGSQGQTVDGPTTTIADPAAVDAAIKSRVDAAKNNPAPLAAIKQSLITKGMDPSKYGLK